MIYVPYGLGLVAVAIAIYAIYRNWRKIVSLLKGKKIAVLGALGVGKTSLIRFLSTRTITGVYIPTLGAEPVKGVKLNLRDLQLKFRETSDVSGSDLAYGLWEDLFNDADLVFYLFRVDQVKSGNTETIMRILQDAKQIRQWIDGKKKDSPTVLAIGTFCDLDPEYKNLSPSSMGRYQDGFMRLEVMREIVRYIDAKWWVLGSMKDADNPDDSRNAEDLAYRIFNTLKGLRK